MSLKGQIQAQCPKSECDSFDTEVWSFVRGDQDETLREAMLAGELNLLVCPECQGLFRADSTVVYCDPKSDLLAFVFPKSFEAEQDKWRAKMQEDFVQMRKMLSDDMPLKSEPLMYFGMEDFIAFLQEEQDIDDEVRIAQFMIPELGLLARPVNGAFARINKLPRILPAVKKTAAARQAAIEGLKILLNANDRLGGYRRWLDYLQDTHNAFPG